MRRIMYLPLWMWRVQATSKGPSECSSASQSTGSRAAKTIHAVNGDDWKIGAVTSRPQDSFIMKRRMN